MEKTLFIFRRDLRIFDNTGLINASSKGQIIPIFIFDPRQIEKNEYFSSNAFEFLINSLKELEREIEEEEGKISFFYGQMDSIILKILQKEKIKAVYTNRDCTPFSKERDIKIREICNEAGVEFNQADDLFLTNISQIKKEDGKPYTVYTHFLKRAFQIPVKKPQYFRGQFSKQKMNGSIEIGQIKYTKNEKLKLKGGRTEALELLQKAVKIENYTEKRNIPELDITTHLSAHNKFGTISIRESYYALANQEQMVKELYWRDFFSSIAENFPKVFKGSFREKYDKVIWNKSPQKLNAWKEGKTGYPIVDAGMRELNETGFMHNRVRMICASFLVKDLHINWRDGERYFAQKLIDYDPSVNNGNWQWCASTGCDAQPYFRIFNPKLQQEKFDPQCRYVKKWISELRNSTVDEIMKLYEDGKAENYPKRIVNHKEEAQISKEMYKRAENSHL